MKKGPLPTKKAVAACIQNVMRRSKKVLVALASIIVAIPALYTLGLFIYVFSAPYWHDLRWATESNLRFDSSKWKAGSLSQISGEDIDPFRQRMVSDLLSRYHLVGMSKAKIVRLLGPPVTYGDKSRYVKRYWLTEAYGIEIDPIAGKDLVITYNKKDIVVKAKVVTWSR